MAVVTSWPEIPMGSLPQDMIALPTIVAEPWVLLDPDPKLFGLEGPAFDQDGNFYACHRAPGPNTPEGVVYKVTPEGVVSEFWHSGDTTPVGIALHKDSRFFLACMGGEIIILSQTGEVLEVMIQEYEGTRLSPNDLVFDRDGDLYFTDFRGDLNNPCGGVYRLNRESGYHTLTRICGNMMSPNGISFSHDFRRLWIGESCSNTVVKLELNEEGTLSHFCGTLPVFRNSGMGAMDSNKVDAAGNIYQTLMGDGRIAILNSEGMAIANVVMPGRENGHFPLCPNLAIHKDEPVGYWLAAGPEGSWVYRFPTLAPAAPSFGFF